MLTAQDNFSNYLTQLVFDHEVDYDTANKIFTNAILNLQPLRKEGHWDKIRQPSFLFFPPTIKYACSRCRGETERPSSYCPTCGATMIREI